MKEFNLKDLERAVDMYQNHGEKGLAFALDMTEDQLDVEITEYCIDHGLHADDDRDDVIYGIIESMEMV